MPINILMPALSPTMEKGNLAKWLKKEGDAVKTGDVIAEIETDKATMEYEAIEDGTLAKIVVPEGTSDVPVNQLIAVMAQEGEDVKAAASAAGKGAAPQPKPAEAPKPARRPAVAAPAAQASAASATPPSTAARTEALKRGAAQRTVTREPRLLLAAGAAISEGSRHRYRPRRGYRPARPRHRPRRGGGEARSSGLRAPAARRGRRSARDRAVDVGSADPRALRRRQLRGRAA